MKTLRNILSALVLILAVGTVNAQTDLLAENLDTQKGKIENLTVKTFKEKVYDYENNTDWKYNGDLPAIVDFYADWCRPCKIIAPILEELAEEYDGKIVIYKVDVDDEKELAQVFQTQSIPSILFIPKEGQPQMAKGALPKETFVEAITNVLKVTK